MGWKIETNFIDKWEVYSTVIDDVIASFESENELKFWLAQEEIYNGKLKAIELFMVFPSSWTINDERQQQKGSLSKYYNWIDNLDYEYSYEKYKKIDDKLNELMGTNL
jgi:hypothetical protein